jgi:hypothetical protein
MADPGLNRQPANFEDEVLKEQEERFALLSGLQSAYSIPFNADKAPGHEVLAEVKNLRK